MKVRLALGALALACLPFAIVFPVRVEGRSMEPTFQAGQRVWVLRRWAAGAPRLAEIWLVEGPQGLALKRVLALPADHLEERRGDLLRNGLRVEEPWVRWSGTASGGPWTGGYLVLGDNRPESRDGRSWGPLPPAALRGRVLVSD